MCRARVLILALFLAAAGILRAQDTISSPSIISSQDSLSSSQPSQPSQDSRLHQTSLPSKGIQSPRTQGSPRNGRTVSRHQKPQVSTVKKEHSATKALLWSLLPGAGQVYNHQAWKIPIIYGAFAGVGYFSYTNGTNMKKFKKEYLYRVNNGGATQLSGYANYPTSNIYNLYQSYNQYFQLSIIIGAVFYGLNLIDAYVFGHLFDYDISDDISLHAAPTMMSVPEYPVPSAPGLSLTFTF